MAKYPESLDDTPPPPRRRRFLTRNLPGLSIVLMVLLLVGIVLWPYMVITVPSGHVGVLWYRFLGFDPYCWCLVDRGTVLNPRELREEGLHIIAPWNRIFIYDLRLQSQSEIYHAISKDGVSVTAEINIRYQLLHNSVGVLHKFVGPDYFNTILSPEIGAQAREVISRFSAQEVYTSREKIQEEIRDDSQRILSEKLNKLVQPAAMEESDSQHYNDFLASSILILDTLVLGIDLPPDIVAAINRQTEQFYMIQEFKYRVEREAEESQRKQIEANGIAAFQRTVSQGISESYLRWQGINATLALAQSANTKVVIIGSGRDGLPIILGNVDAPAAGGATQPGGGPKPPGAAAPGTAPGAAPGAAAPGAAVPGASENVPGGANPNFGVFPGGPPSMGGAPRPGGVSGGPVPSASAPNAQAGAAGNSPNRPPAASNPSVLQDVGSVLSRIYGSVRGSNSAPDAETGTGPNP
jgi:regulator of protease activity HflC (stomatin/prohibitin superfamily)